MRGVRGVIGAPFGLTHRALIIGALFALARPCGAQSSPAQRDSIQAQVQAALDSLTDVWRRGDLDGEMRFYLDSALVVINGRLRSPSEYYRAGIERRRRGVLGESQRIGAFQPIRFDVLSRDAVVVSWANAFAVIDTGGHALPTRLAANTYVWVRRGGAWRILVAHESNRIASDSVSLPPPVAPSADSDQLHSLLKDVPELPVERIELAVHPPLMLEKISAVTTDKHGNIYIIHRSSHGNPIVVLGSQGNDIRSGTTFARGATACSRCLTASASIRTGMCGLWTLMALTITGGPRQVCPLCINKIASQ